MKKSSLVGRDSKTGRFVSLKKEKPLYIKETKAPKVKKEPKVEDFDIQTSKPKKKVKEEESFVQVLKATYGVDTSIVEVDTTRVVVGKKVSNKMAGSDPAPKVKKTLSVTVMVYDKEVTKSFNEGEVIEF